MSEKEPIIQLRIGDEEVDLMPEDTIVNSYQGESAVYDHMYVKPSHRKAFYWWRITGPTGEESPSYRRAFRRAIKKLGTAAYLNMPEAPEDIKEAYFRYVMRYMKKDDDIQYKWQED